VTVRLSLLALLDQGPGYGYQLRAELDWRTGSISPINVGQIYNTLDRLERDELVRKTGENNYYEITPRGSAAVAGWFATASPLAELPAKLALAATLPGVDVGAILRVQRASAGEITIDFRPPATVAELAAAILAQADAAATASETRLLDDVEALLALGIRPLALSNEIPRRGRPRKEPAVR
jgi:DNA-binding PadR family transcriptional regulator